MLKITVYKMSDYRGVGLLGCRTIGVSDYRGVGLLGCRTIGVTDYWGVRLSGMPLCHIYVMDTSSHFSHLKPKTIKLVCVASSLITQH